MFLWPHKVEQQKRAGGHILAVFQLVCSFAGPMPFRQSPYADYQIALLF